VPRTDALSVAWHVMSAMGGRRPYYVPHNASRKKFSAMFLEKEQRRSMIRVAQTLALNPAIKGFMSEGWLLSPNLAEASPHLGWMMDINRELVELGALFTHTGEAAPDSGFQVGDRRRAELYQTGRWKPLNGVLLAPRAAMIEWARTIAVSEASPAARTSNPRIRPS
jgi:hypothetical protein